jgi:hypothetical protein
MLIHNGIMPKEKWAHADEIEAVGKIPEDPNEVNPESYSLPVTTKSLGEFDESKEKDIFQIAEDYLESDQTLKNRIDSENLDVVALKTENKNGKTKWVLLIGFGFAALGLGIAGYKIIRKYKKIKNDKLN